MFFEKTTTFTLTDIRSCGDICQGDFFCVMILDIHQDIFQTGSVPGSRAVCLRDFVRQMTPQKHPDMRQTPLQFHLVSRRWMLRQFPDLREFLENLSLPVDRGRKCKTMDSRMLGNDIQIFALQHTALISVKKTWMKCGGNIDTVRILVGRGGMQTVAVAENPLTCGKMIDGIVDLILHLSL